MKKLIAIILGLGLVLGTSFAAMADVDVKATIDKEKNKEVTETVNIDKAIYVGVKQVVKPSNSVEAQAIKNDVNEKNTIDEFASPGVAPEYVLNEITNEMIELTPGKAGAVVEKNAAIDTGSLDGSAGIVNLNQSPGSLNNQGNAASVSYSGAAIDVKEVAVGDEGETRFVGGAFLHAEASAEKIMGGEVEDGMPSAATQTDEVKYSNTVYAEKTKRNNTIDDAMKGMSGVIGVNQSAGNINNQNNAVALSVGDKSVASLSEADLGMVSANNYSEELATALNDTISNGALGASAGIINVNQSSGCMNNQANVVAVCAVSFPSM